MNGDRSRKKREKKKIITTVRNKNSKNRKKIILIFEYNTLEYQLEKSVSLKLFLMVPIVFLTPPIFEQILWYT